MSRRKGFMADSLQTNRMSLPLYPSKAYANPSISASSSNLPTPIGPGGRWYYNIATLASI
jgi:hypothetical protein